MKRRIKVMKLPALDLPLGEILWKYEMYSDNGMENQENPRPINRMIMA